MTDEKWRQILYLHAVKISKATDSTEVRDAIRAAEAIVKLAQASGVSISVSDFGDGHKVTDSRQRTSELARRGVVGLRADQVVDGEGLELEEDGLDLVDSSEASERGD